MKTIFAALALVLVSAQAQAGVYNVALCHSNIKGNDVGTTLNLQYDTTEQTHKLTISIMSIMGTRTIVNDVVALPHPMVAGAPEAFESSLFKLVLYPRQISAKGFAAKLQSKGRFAVLTDYTCVRIRQSN